MSTTSDNDRTRRQPRLRFSLAALMLLTMACALSLAIGKWFFDEPPTHKIPGYEKAPGTRRETIDIGPNRVGIKLIARNDRDGSIHYENGRGKTLTNVTAKNVQSLINAAPWLDVVQIELEPTPNRLDVIDIRIFDHTTRTRITDIDPAFGWRLVEPDILQIYGLGKSIPPEIDVWLRLHSYAADDAIATLPPTPQSSCSTPIGKITIDDVRAGRWGWSIGIGFVPIAGMESERDTISVVVMLDRTRIEDDNRQEYQLVPVSKSGERTFGSYPHFLPRWRPGQSGQVPLFFDISLDDLSHFEIRPFGGRHRFFFDAVKLPATSTSPFSPPPIVKLPVAGQEIDVDIPELAPLKVRVATHRGDWVGGISYTEEQRAKVLPRFKVNELDKQFSIVKTVEGIGLPLNHQSLLAPSSPLNTSSTRGGQQGGGAPYSATYEIPRSPLDAIQDVEVSFLPLKN